jgi:hypothetical protein
MSSPITTANIERVARQVSNDRIVLALLSPEPWAAPHRCFSNVERALDLYEDALPICGWTFNFRLAPAGWYVYLGPHTVVQRPPGHLLDITPLDADAERRPLIENGAVVFLVDRKAYPVEVGDQFAPLPSRYFPIDDNSELSRYVDKLNAEEQEACRALYAMAQPG